MSPRPESPPAPDPDAEARAGCVEALGEIHRRYQLEVVEELGVCPFARRSRELGRVHRPIYLLADRRPSPDELAAELVELIDGHADAEIILPTFAGPEDDAFAERADFERFLAQTREAFAAFDVRPFYMVAFHPHASAPEVLHTPEAFVPSLRRAPDPLIQCVDATVLDKVRREAQRVSHARTLEQLRARSPELATLFAQSVQPDSQLSAEIAQTNFERLAAGEGRTLLEARLEDIHRARAELSRRFPRWL